MKLKLAAAIVIIATVSLCGCNKKEEPHAAAYVQSEYAKNPDGDCARRPNEFYSDKAKTKGGVEELIFMACQYKTRGYFHSAKGQKSPGAPGDPDSSLAKAIRCFGEAVSAVEALQLAGVTSYSCGGTIMKTTK